jgi:hypothetical protein
VDEKLVHDTAIDVIDPGQRWDDPAEDVVVA